MPFKSPGVYVKDQDGFTPPDFGGGVAVKYRSVTFANSTAVTLFTLPKGAVIVGWLVNITTAFNGTGADLLRIGRAGTANAYANDLDLASAVQLVTGFSPAEMFVALTADTAIQATYVNVAADASAGAATVCVKYILR